MSPRDPWLWGLVAAGLALRVGVALAVDSRMLLLNDELTYAERAVAWLAFGELETGIFVRPPLYFLFVGQVQRLAGPEAWQIATKLVQCAVGALTALPVYALARRVADRRAALLAAACLLFDPALVAYTHLLWPETLFTGIVALAFAALPGAETRAVGRVVTLGVLTGFAMLFKPVFGIFAALVALDWLARSRTALRSVLVFGCAATLLVAPWALRNGLRYGPGILLENQAAYNLWVGNDPRPAQQVRIEWKSLGDPVTRSRTAWERGWQAIAEAPGRFVASSARRALNVWGLEFFVTRHAILGGYGEVSRATLLALFWSLQLAWALVLLLAAAGLPALLRERSLRPVVLYPLAVTLLVAGMVGSTRFRVPFAVPLCVAAGAGASALLAGTRQPRRSLAMALAAGLLLLSATRPVFRELIAARFDAPAELRRDDWMTHRY